MDTSNLGMNRMSSPPCLNLGGRWPSQGRGRVRPLCNPSLELSGGSRFEGLQTGPEAPAHFAITPARWRCSPQGGRPEGLQSSRPASGGGSSGQLASLPRAHPARNRAQLLAARLPTSVSSKGSGGWRSRGRRIDDSARAPALLLKVLHGAGSPVLKAAL
ncbi:unnamed protein product [Rangifer tarandus platyrhynchus]|uniref:Uncharacterized protein n=2 Tax=Rangifer tarandus platyrhynchus TaxID=3082113 RepID=A0ABN8YF26_RANTA|nr:unnamed protein product [Rangifer tarandus platyrhynchus]CAI9698320.1 unnamed protein product [Rangifer tarandus platyrhynchus]